MCGICGYIGLNDESLLVQMTEMLTHRGPDDHGYFKDESVGLGHRRLSVIDLSTGHQPMFSPDESSVIVYNGEIYNYRELRDSLEQRGHTFQTASDTEVLLRLCDVEGPNALTELNGMFAFAVYDRRERSLFLARDRIGIKPLYYLELPGRFLFASEAKALLCYRDWSPTFNPRAIHDYLALRYVPGDRTVFNEIRRVPAGQYLIHRNGRTLLHRYWHPPEHDHPTHRSEEECLEELGSLMEKSVRRRLISDVPLGAYLSGGLDSSTIVGAMAKLVSTPIKTFCVGFDYKHDELNQAAATAKYLGCDHHEIPCRPKDVSLLPDIVHHLDEPMGDAIIIPMFQLSREAKRHVTVILTGEGGDEIFAGYLFHKVMRLGETYRRIAPSVLRSWVLQPLLTCMPASVLNMAFKYPAELGRRGKTKALDYLRLLDPTEIDRAYRHLISLFDQRDTADLYTPAFSEMLNGAVGAHASVCGSPKSTRGAYLNRLLELQFDHWLPDNMLLRQDKTGMAHGIEGRVPFLDHELVDFAMRLPPHLKLHRLTGKYLLRRYAAGLLPKPVVQRRKMPFYVPIENYFQQQDFEDLMDDLLNDDAVRRRGLFRPAAVARLRTMMHRREFLFVKQVFSLMVLELWFRHFADKPPTTGFTTQSTVELASRTVELRSSTGPRSEESLRR
ncbi:MAG: asparagine synthase (glutamine-hydrolyzing) [Phycisphaerae bacterium]